MSSRRRDDAAGPRRVRTTRCARRSRTCRRSSAACAPVGRRSALVEKLKVDAYGSEVPLQQIAGFGVPEPRVLAISPYDKGTIKAIEKAIQQSDLGINPSNDGQVIRLVFPELTEERRKDLVKVVTHPGRGGPGRRAQRPPPGPPGARGAREGRRARQGRPRPGREGAREARPTRSIAEIDELLEAQGGASCSTDLSSGDRGTTPERAVQQGRRRERAARSSLGGRADVPEDRVPRIR